MHVNASIVILFLSLRGFEREVASYTDVTITFMIGLIWEVAEYLTTPETINYWTIRDIGFGWHDTKGDLLSNVIGIIIGYVSIIYYRKATI
jgi:hypothetical protein